MTDDVKKFGLNSVLTVVSGAVLTLDGLNPAIELVEHMVSASLHKDGDSHYQKYLGQNFMGAAPICAKALLGQFPILQELMQDFRSECAPQLEGKPRKTNARIIDSWIREKAAKLPPELSEGFPVPKLPEGSFTPIRQDSDFIATLFERPTVH